MTINARNQRAAEKWASKNGIVWSSIALQPVDEPPSEFPAVATYTAEKDAVIWLIGAVAILLSLLISDEPIGFSSAVGLGYLIGAALFSFILVLLLGFIGAKIAGATYKRARIGFIIGAFIAVSMPAIGQYRIRQYREREVSAAAQEAIAQGREMLAATTPPTPSSGLSASEAADDKAVLSEIRRFWSDAKKSGDQYVENIKKITGGDLMAPQNLDTVDKIVGARQKLGEILRLVNAQEQTADAMFDALPNRINALSISTSAKESAIKGYGETLNQSEVYVQQIMETDRETIEEESKLLDFLQARIGKFRVADSIVYFDDGDDVASYNAILVRVRQLLETEQQQHEQQQQFAQKQLDGFEKLLP